MYAVYGGDQGKLQELWLTNLRLRNTNIIEFGRIEILETQISELLIRFPMQVGKEGHGLVELKTLTLFFVFYIPIRNNIIEI